MSHSHGAGGRTIGTPAVWIYAAPALAFALPTVPAAVHLPSLHMATLGVGTVGAVLFLARMSDVIIDPLIGWLGDATGRRKLLVAIGAVVCGLGAWRLFVDEAAFTALSFGLWSVALFAGWACISIHHAAWGNEIASGYNQRTSLNGARESVALVGILAAVAIPALLVGMGWSNREAIGAIVVGALVLGAATLALALLLVPELKRGSVAMAPKSARAMLAGLLGNRLFLRLVSVWILNGIANGLPAALFSIYVVHGLGGSEVVAAQCLLIYFGAGIAGIPFWLWLSRRLGRHRTWGWAMLMAAGVFLLVPFLPHGAVGAFMLVCLVSGCALGADLMLPPAIQGDVCDYDRLRAGQNRTGLLFALWAMAQKFAQACAIGLGFGLLALAGFDPGQAGSAGDHLIPVIYAGIPVVFKVVAAGVVWNFPLNEARHLIVRRRLEAREMKL